MTDRERRLGILVVACVLALGVAGQAVAAYTPTFSASTNDAGASISYTQGAADDPPAAITFWVPAGFTALLAFSEGDVIGTATGKAVAADLGGALISLTGTINAALPTTTISFAGATTPLSALAVLCTGTATHSGYWVINLSASGQTLQVPAYVDDIPITNPLSELANTTIRVCLPPPDVPTGTPGRASLGAKVTAATLSPNVFSAPPGWYTWRLTATPYTPATGKANAAGTVEVQSIDRSPQELTLKARAVKSKRRTAAVSGRVIAGGKGVSGVDVSILIGKTVVARAKSKAGGTYSARITLPRAAATLTATATAASRSAAGCTGSFPPVPCTGSSYSGFTAKSAAVRVRT